MGTFFSFLHIVKNRTRSERDYFTFEQRMAKLLLPTVRPYLVDQRVLDLAGGRGGYTEVFSHHAKEIYLVDLAVSHQRTERNITFINGDALALPFDSEYFDFVFCSSLIEHVDDQPRLLSEIHRVLRRGGVALVSFPPFYSIIGGHQVKPFHYLPEKIAIALAKRFRSLPDSVTAYSNLFGSFGLHKTTIRRAKAMIKMSKLRLIRYDTRFLPLNVARLPVLGEFLAWHVQFWLTKD